MSPQATTSVKQELDAHSLRLNEVAKEVHEVKEELHELHEDFHDLKNVLIRSVPLGDPEKHFQHHQRLEQEREEYLEERAERKKTIREIKNKALIIIVTACIGLIGLGLAEKFRELVNLVVDGKSASEIKAQATK